MFLGDHHHRTIMVNLILLEYFCSPLLQTRNLPPIITTTNNRISFSSSTPHGNCCGARVNNFLLGPLCTSDVEHVQRTKNKIKQQARVIVTVVVVFIVPYAPDVTQWAVVGGPGFAVGAMLIVATRRGGESHDGGK